jgi:signal transduction histidine kinase
MLKLTVVDFGVGIPSNVRLFRRTPNIAAASAIRWAFQRGTTTKPNGTGRGLGLDLLKEFVQLNQGRLEVFSHDGYALIGEGQERYETRQSYFEGTLVNITLRCDERHYRLADEVAPEFLF